MSLTSIILICLGLAGTEGLLIVAPGGFAKPLVALSLMPLALAVTGLILAYRRHRALAEECTITPQNIDTPVPVENLESATAGTASTRAMIKPLNTRVYEEAFPALFRSIIDYLNKTSDPMSETLVKIKTVIAEFLSNIHQSKASFESTECTTKLKDGINQLRTHITDITNETSRSFSDFSSEIDRLNEQMMSILELVGNISDVAERVHVLSINASIESARAGVHGRGFKVIADEIQKLSKETQSFVTTIGSTVGKTKEVFRSLQTVMDSNQKNISRQVTEDSSTYDDISHVLAKQLNEFLELYSGIVRFIESLELDMNTLSPLAMLHAIITQEIENLEGVTLDVLTLLKDRHGDPDSLAAAFANNESIDRLRKRLTTSRELDALDSVIRKLGLHETLDLKRTNTEIEMF